MLRKDGMAYSHVLSLLQKAERPNKAFTTANERVYLPPLPPPPSVKPEGCFPPFSLPTVPKIMQTTKLIFWVLRVFS